MHSDAQIMSVGKDLGKDLFQLNKLLYQETETQSKGMWKAPKSHGEVEAAGVELRDPGSLASGFTTSNQELGAVIIFRFLPVMKYVDLWVDWYNLSFL